MKRNSWTVMALLTLLCSTGCCYRPGAINPYNGIAYGGRWEPMPGGPLDLAACCGPAYCGPTMPAADCCNVCEPPCGVPAAGHWMTGSTANGCDPGCATTYPQTYMPAGPVMPHGSESVPNSGMRPVPDPQIQPKVPKNGGTTTYVLPQPLPVHMQTGVGQTSSVPWVQAH